MSDTQKKTCNSYTYVHVHSHEMNCRYHGPHDYACNLMGATAFCGSNLPGAFSFWFSCLLSLYIGSKDQWCPTLLYIRVIYALWCTHYEVLHPPHIQTHIVAQYVVSNRDISQEKLHTNLTTEGVSGQYNLMEWISICPTSSLPKQCSIYSMAYVQQHLCKLITCPAHRMLRSQGMGRCC